MACEQRLFIDDDQLDNANDTDDHKSSPHHLRALSYGSDHIVKPLDLALHKMPISACSSGWCLVASTAASRSSWCCTGATGASAHKSEQMVDISQVKIGQSECVRSNPT